MLTHKGDYWIIDAKKSDIWYDRFIHRDELGRVDRDGSKESPLFLREIIGLSFGLVVLAVFLAAVGALDTLLNPLAFGTATMAFLLILVLCIAMYLPARHREAMHPSKFFEASGEYERFELKLLLMPEIRSNRKLLWKHRHAINNYLAFSQRNDTYNFGVDVERRPAELEYRQKKVYEAKKHLVEMGIDPQHAEMHCLKTVADLNSRERELLNELTEHAESGIAGACSAAKDCADRLEKFRQVREMMAANL